MSISSISAVGGGYNYATSPYAPPPASTLSVTRLASGATVTTVRGSTGDVLAVTTAVAAGQGPGAANNPAAQIVAQTEASSFYVTA